MCDAYPELDKQSKKIFQSEMKKLLNNLPVVQKLLKKLKVDVDKI